MSRVTVPGPRRQGGHNGRPPSHRQERCVLAPLVWYAERPPVHLLLVATPRDQKAPPTTAPARLYVHVEEWCGGSWQRLDREFRSLSGAELWCQFQTVYALGLGVRRPLDPYLRIVLESDGRP